MAKDSRKWQDAKLTGITSKTSDNGIAVVPIGSSIYGVPMRKTFTYYRIETPSMTYVLAWGGQHALNLTLHGNVKISIDSNGKNAHILDDGGKDVKVPLIQKVAKEINP